MHNKKRGTKFFYKNHHVVVREKDIKLPNGARIKNYPLVTHNDGVVVVPFIAKKGKIYIMLVKQWRIAMNVKTLEVVGGILEKEGPKKTAVKEVKEETGLTVKNLIYMGQNLPGPGWHIETQYNFLAECYPEIEKQHLDDTESITRVLLPVEKVREMLSNGRIKDLKSKSALYEALDFFARHQKYLI